jgi:transposase
VCASESKPRKIDLHEVFCGVQHLFKSGCQWRLLPSEFPKWRTVHSYFAKRSEPDRDGVSVLERALKKSGGRGPYGIGMPRKDELLDRRCAEREERSECEAQRL